MCGLLVGETVFADHCMLGDSYIGSGKMYAARHGALASLKNEHGEYPGIYKPSKKELKQVEWIDTRPCLVGAKKGTSKLNAGRILSHSSPSTGGYSRKSLSSP